MKLLNATLTVLALGVASASAGPLYQSPTYTKNPKAVVPVDPSCPCFFEGFQVGAFVSGVWGPDSLGNEYLNNPVPGAAASEGDDALGAGVSLAYYFTRNIALEYSYSWQDTRSDRHIHTLDFLWRMPLGYTCWAPYLIGGGGLNTDGGTRGIYRAGGGIEYRLANCVGIFADYTYNWIAGGDAGWDNSFNLARAGLRIPF